MDTIAAAMDVLCLHRDFTAEQLRKQYYRMALLHHPDKRGGSDTKMKEVTAAHELLAAWIQQPEPQVDIQSSPTPVPSTAQPTQWAKEFLDRLHDVPRQHLHRQSAMKLYHDIHKIATDPRMAALKAMGDGCVHLMVLYVNARREASMPAGWTSCGFKFLSYRGYDVDRLRVIDYGNREYLAVLQFWSLASPNMKEHLGSLQEVWPTYFDLWRENKTGAHIERLADVVEIIIAAVRDEKWFQSVTKKYRPLPEFYNLLVAVCRLVQHLDARLHSGYLKHKREMLPKFKSMQECEFCKCWSDSRFPQGLLLYSLFEASVQNKR